MKCLTPNVCFKCGMVHCKSDGVLSPHLVFSQRDAHDYFFKLTGSHSLADKMCDDNSISVPCGKCAACQIQKRKDMSVRLTHEASQFEKSCFITLTYNDDNVPSTDTKSLDDDSKVFSRGVSSGSRLTLMPRDVQLFIKRLRRHLEYVPKRGKGVRDHISRIRYFAVGEYGSRTSRPHYHIIIFGWCPSDAVPFKVHKGNSVYRSAQIEKLWSYGFSSFSEVSPFVAKYCARYVTKKFARLSSVGSDCVVPEFTLQSVRNGGIGATWFDKFGESACSLGLCNVRYGDRVSRCSIPKYYWNRLRKCNLPLWLACRDERIDFVKRHPQSQSAYDDLVRSVDCYAHLVSLESESEYF